MIEKEIDEEWYGFILILYLSMRQCEHELNIPMF